MKMLPSIWFCLTSTWSTNTYIVIASFNPSIEHFLQLCPKGLPSFPAGVETIQCPTLSKCKVWDSRVSFLSLSGCWPCTDIISTTRLHRKLRYGSLVFVCFCFNYHAFTAETDNGHDQEGNHHFFSVLYSLYSCHTAK